MRLLLTAFITISLSTAFAQQEQQSTAGYLKVSAELYFANSGNSSPVSAGYLGGGFVFANSFAVGADLGIYKLKQYKKPIIPLGAQLSVSNFSARKLSPILQFGCYYPVYKETETGSFSTGTSIVNSVSESRGKLQLKGGGGILVSSGDKAKILVTAGISQIYIQYKVSSTTITNGDAQTITSNETGKDHYYLVSFAFMFN